jgi:hypothetical protein
MGEERGYRRRGMKDERGIGIGTETQNMGTSKRWIEG